MKSDTEAGVEYTPESIKGFVGGIMPSVELATSGFAMPELAAFKTLGAPSLIADNACHGCLVLGDELVEDLAGESDSTTFASFLNSLDEKTCTLKVNGDKVADGVGNQVLGHPLNALSWLANALGKRGEILRKGDIITTGVCVDQLVLAKAGDSVSICYEGMGEVTFNVIK